jgi:hypothetical protein
MSETVTAVTITSATLDKMITRRLARISRQLVFRLSQYRIAGRNSSRTRSGSNSTSVSRGMRPSNTPRTISSTGGATLDRPPNVVPTITVLTRTTTTTRPST